MKKTVLALLSVVLAACTPATAMNVLSKTEGHLNQSEDIYRLDETWLKSYTSFAFDLHRQMADDKENTFFSPASILLALGMTAQGANDQTLRQMLDVFHMGQLDAQSFAESMKLFQQRLLTPKTHTLNLGNSIWMRKGYDTHVKEDFLSVNRDYYGAFIAALDFNDPAASKTINQWVKDNTKGLIDKIVEDQISPLTVMFLINTVYFKADWQDMFDKNLTRNYTLYAKTAKQIKFMNQDAYFPYVETEDYQAVMIPYKDFQSSMIVFLPKEGKDVRLTAELYDQLFKELSFQIISAYRGKLVRLSLPKMELATEIKLVEVLKNLGMTDAFNPAAADFSNLSTTALTDQLHIANVLHKAVLKVDEKGTEAAAATSVEIGVTSVPEIDAFMKVDRPFTVILADATGAILFMGDVLDPQ